MSYTDRQLASDATYARAYREWVASLPPEERARLAAQGLLEPDASRRTSTREGDALRLELTAAPVLAPIENRESKIENAASAADALAAFCARIRAHPNPLLAFDAACFASGLMDVEGLSQSELAKRHGVTRAAFSKLAIQWAETFGLPPSRGMRSKNARTAYRQARLTSLRKAHDRHHATRSGRAEDLAA